MVYGDDPRRARRARSTREPSVDVALFLEDGEVVARRDGDEDVALLDEYPGRPRARRGGAPQPERRRGARLGRAGLGVRRPRGPAPSRRRQPRLARRRATPRCRCSRSASATPPASITGIKALVLEHFGVPVARARDASLTGSSGSSAAAGSATSACSRRWRASRASSSSPRSCASDAYDDAALPLAARPDDLAAVHRRAASARRSRSTGDERVLDVGTGSGYQAAVLAELAAEVHSIERIPELAEAARAALAAAGLRARRGARRRRLARLPGARAVRRDRGRRGGAGASRQPLWDQLGDGGRIVLPLREPAAATSSSASSSGRRTRCLALLAPCRLGSVPARDRS